MSDQIDDLQAEIDQASAEGERVCSQLQGQLDQARALVAEAKIVLQCAEDQRRSFAPNKGRTRPE